MPRFYFDVFDGRCVLVDEFGDEFDSDAEAAIQAVSLLPDLAHDRVPKEDNLDIAVSVRNDKGEVIYRSISAIRSQWPDREHYLFRVKVDNDSCVITNSRRLRTEAQELSERLRVNTLQIFSVLESASATIAVSRRLIRGDGA